MVQTERITIQLPEEDVVCEVSGERFSRPLLKRAGILDVDEMFAGLPEKLIESCGLYPDIDSLMLSTITSELIQEALRVSGRDLHQHQLKDEGHWLYPVIEGGSVHALAKTKLFQRLYGVHQLGLARYYPIRNLHNRGEHSVFLAINMTRSLQALYDKDREMLLNKLQSDFARENLAPPELRDEELLNMAGDLTVAVSMLHDLATPAGGDTLKYLLGLSEEDDLEWLFFQSGGQYQAETEEIRQIFAAWGMDERHLRYVTKCIQGKSDTLVGQMINPIKDELDWDRTAYTLLDAQATTILDVAGIPTVLLPQRLRFADHDLILERLISAVDALDGEFLAVAGLSPLGMKPGDLHPFVPTSLIDFSEDSCLGRKLGVVCERPDKLVWVAAIRVWMTGLHYAGFKMLGLEWELQRQLKDLQARGIGIGLLRRETLLGMTDEQLFAELGRLDDPVLCEILERNTTIVGTSQFRGELLDQDAIPVKHPFASFPLKIKPGLESLVSEGLRTTTLGEWAEENQDLIPAAVLMAGINEFREKKVVIYKS